MTIESITPSNKIVQTESGKSNNKNFKAVTKCVTSTDNLDTDIRLTVDDATGLLQSIVTDKISDKVLRKLPSDEYLHLLSLLDEIVDGSISKRV